MDTLRRLSFVTLLGLFSALPLLFPPAAVAAPAPDFTLHTSNGETETAKSLKGKIVVLEWFNKGCPYVQRAYRETPQLAKLQEETLHHADVRWFIINSTNAAQQDYIAPDQVSATLAEWKTPVTSYVDDHEGTLGHLFEAKTTPSFVIIGKDGEVLYHGALDNYPELAGDDSKTRYYLRQALEEVLARKSVSVPETEQYGCSVKYGS